MDLMHQRTDKELAKLEKRLKVEYKKALKDLKQTAKAYFKSFAVLEEKKLKDLNNNKISYDDYIQWRMNFMTTGARYNDTINLMSKRLVEADKNASVLMNGIIPDTYIDNYNFTKTEIPKGISLGANFMFINSDTLNNVLDLNNRILPKPKVNIPKDMKWNNRKIRSAISQGIIQGESVGKIANRLQSVTDMSKNSAIRNARTAITGAENAGRFDGYDYMIKIGLHPKKKWMATHDIRTRESHRMLDGEVREVDEPFSNGLMFPADPNGIASEVYNCRCTLIAVFDDEENENMVAEPMSNIEILNDKKEDIEEYLDRMSLDDSTKFRKMFNEIDFVEGNDGNYYNRETNQVIISNIEHVSTLPHEATHWFDYNHKIYDIIEDYGKTEYVLDKNGDWTGEKRWISNPVVAEKNVSFSKYITHEWSGYKIGQDKSFSQEDIINFVKKVGTSDTYGYERDASAVEHDMKAINKYLDEKGIDRFDPDFHHLSDFISALSYDSNLGSLSYGGHSYDYWLYPENRVSEIIVSYNILKRLGKEDFLDIERDLAPKLMNLIESEWEKIWKEY